MTIIAFSTNPSIYPFGTVS